MKDTLRIAAYTRISVDIELDRDNTSIENQKAIIGDYCKIHFPTARVDYFEDRDHSGYTFEQRPGYMQMRAKLFAGEYDILIVKDLSRFSRRTSRGLVEFEDLCEKNIRIIAIGDGVDYPVHDDAMKIKIYFFVNEMPVTDASRKVSAVIANRQEKGEWICSVPYGYVITNSKKMTFEVDEPAAEVVREVFRLYNEGWGYKKIANHLTDRHIPTPRMRERARKEAAGEEYRGKVKESWSIVTISEMLTNDFYIGTLRQRKYHRKKINGDDVELDKNEHIVFENHHPAIVDYRVFATAQELLKKRTTGNYRGVKKYDNTYSGFLYCGDCGSPMFSLSRADLPGAYTCGTYHVRGRSGCTSHYVKADFLDSVIKRYLRRVRDNSEGMLRVLEEVISHDDDNAERNLSAVGEIEKEIETAKEELKHLTRQKVRDLARAGDSADVIAETYDGLISEAANRISGLENQLRMIADSNNTMVRVGRLARTVIGVFDDILNKDKLDKNDLNLIIDRVLIFEDHIDLKLRSDVDELLRTGNVESYREGGELAVNFKHGTADNESADGDYTSVAVSSARNRRDKVYRVNVVSEGDPLEIYTDREGEVIFKKYSPIGELAAFAGQYAETLHKTCSLAVVICDRDAVIACSGVSRKEYVDKSLSDELEAIIEGRTLYMWREGSQRLPVIADSDNHYLSCAMPIISEGDIIGCVASVADTDGEHPRDIIGSEVESKLIQTAAGFLGKQLES